MIVDALVPGRRPAFIGSLSTALHPPPPNSNLSALVVACRRAIIDALIACRRPLSSSSSVNCSPPPPSPPPPSQKRIPVDYLVVCPIHLLLSALPSIFLPAKYHPHRRAICNAHVAGLLFTAKSSTAATPLGRFRVAIARGRRQPTYAAPAPVDG